MRKSILAADASLDPEFVRSNKEGIDNLIKEIFSTVSASKQADGQYQVDQESQDEDRKGHSNKSQPPHPAQSSAAENAARDDDNRADTPHSKQELDDEEYARRVSAEINAGARGRTTRGSSANGAVSSASAAKRRKYAKSKVKSPSKIIDSDASASEGPDGYDDNDDEDGGDSRSKKKGVKRRRTKGDGDGGGAKGGFGKEFLLSEPLSAVCEGAIQLSRPQVVKALWKYIKVSGTVYYAQLDTLMQ